MDLEKELKRLFSPQQREFKKRKNVSKITKKKIESQKQEEEKQSMYNSIDISQGNAAIERIGVKTADNFFGRKNTRKLANKEDNSFTGLNHALQLCNENQKVAEQIKNIVGGQIDSEMETYKLNINKKKQFDSQYLLHGATQNEVDNEIMRNQELLKQLRSQKKTVLLKLKDISTWFDESQIRISSACQEIENQKAMLKSQIEIKQVELNDREMIIKFQFDEVNQQMDELKKELEQIEKAKSEIAQRQQEQAEKERKLNIYKRKIDKDKMKIKADKEQMDKERQEIEQKLQENQSQMRKQQSESSQKENDLQSQIESHQDKINSLNTQIEIDNEKFRKEKQNLENLVQSEKAKIQQQKKDLDLQIKQGQTMIAQLEEQIKVTEQTIEELTETIQQMETDHQYEIQLLKQDLIDKEDEIEKLKISIAGQQSTTLNMPQDFSQVLSPIEPDDFDNQPQDIKDNYYTKVFCNSLIKPPPTTQELKVTETVIVEEQKQIERDAKSGKTPKPAYFQILKEFMKQYGAEFNLAENRQKSNFESLASLASDQLNLACFSVQIPQFVVNQTQTYQKLFSDKTFRYNYETGIQHKIANQFKREFTDVSIVNSYPSHNDLIINYVIKNVLKSDNQIPNYIKNAQSALTSYFKQKVQICKAEMFKYFFLAKEDFDSQGDYQFTSDQGDKQERGGYVYWQPSKLFFRVGLKVRGKFDTNLGQDKDKWLDDFVNGWATAFHGLRNDVQKALPGIYKDGFRTGGVNAYADTDDIGKNRGNFQNKKCGEGVYLCPKVEYCMGENFAKISYTRPIQLGNKYYLVLFSCKVNPTKIREPKGTQGQYYIVNHKDDIRPYGIILKELTKQERDDFCQKYQF